ncbi:MAG: LysM peptidoglycan-binding domain-containing protein [Anaerolineae bacterium]
MKRGVWFKGVVLLVLVVMVAGLGACSRSAEEREGPTSTPAASAVVDTGSGQQTAPAPGETVVSAVSPVPQTPGTDVQPTATEATPVVEPTVEATATPAPTSPSTSGGQQGQYVTHTVQRGETLSSIARQYGTTWQAIAQANNIANPSQIYAGQSLKVPTTSGGTSGGSSGGTAGCRYRHTVQRGEWLWQIAREYGVSPYAIMSANGLSLPSASTIYAGTVLCIP